jgi:hypothetical protein
MSALEQNTSVKLDVINSDYVFGEALNRVRSGLHTAEGRAAEKDDR